MSCNCQAKSLFLVEFDLEEINSDKKEHKFRIVKAVDGWQAMHLVSDFFESSDTYCCNMLEAHEVIE